MSFNKKYIPTNKILPIAWTPEKLKEFREKCGLSLNDCASFLDVTKTTLIKIEDGTVTNPINIKMYGILLERLYAYTQGYLPSFRKIGTAEFKEGDTFYEENFEE